MYKIWRYSLAAVLAVTLILTTTNIKAAEHTHTFGAWQTVKAATCTSASEEYRQCTDGSCNFREYTSLNVALGHDMGGYAVTKVPNCTTNGVETNSCNRCTYTETRAIPALGHNMGGYAVTKIPTCTTNGVETSQCSRCAYVETRAIAALGHDMGGYAVTKIPTCTESGIESRKCNRCTYTETRALAALGHQLTAWTVSSIPKCTENGAEVRTCARAACSYSEYRAIAASGHNLGVFTVAKAPTCTDMGLQERKCSNCAYTLAANIPALGHDLNAWSTTVAAGCTTAGEQKATCKRCGYEVKQFTLPLGHTYGPWTVTKQATCTEGGSEMRLCTRCGASESRQTKKAPHEAKPSWIAIRQPTPQRLGLKVRYCVFCDKIIQRAEYALKSAVYNEAAHAFGVPAASLDASLSGVRAYLIPLNREVPVFQLPIVTENGWQIGMLTLNLADDILTITSEFYADNTYVAKASYLLLDAAEPIGAENFGVYAQERELEVPASFAGMKNPAVSIRLIASFDTAVRANKQFSNDGLFTDGVTPNAEILRKMLMQLNKGE